ncbi:MAG: PP2C family serine/threonine-protein phosphatase [Treponemataceae bacterium]
MFKRRKNIWGVSVRGPAHYANGLPNQDSFLIKKTRKGLVAVVADGLGSKPHSDKGAREACRAVLKAIRTFENLSVQIYDLLLLIQGYWTVALKNFPASKCSSTCLFVYISDTGIFAARLGDGMIFLLGKDDTSSEMLTDIKEDSFSNATFCLTSKNIFSHWEVKKFSKELFSSILLCTDGISSDLKDGRQKDFVKEFSENVFKKNISQNKKDTEEMLVNWPVKGHSDDKTLVFIEL